MIYRQFGSGLLFVEPPCTQEAERALHKLDSSMKQVEALHVELAAYYCEDESTFVLDEAFKVIRTFCDKLQKAVQVHRQSIPFEHENR